MRWKRGYRSKDVVDRRAAGPARRKGLAVGAGGSVVALIIVLVFGQDALKYLGGGSSSSSSASSSQGNQGSQPKAEFKTTPEEEELVSFINFVLDDVQNHWDKRFQSYYGGPYKRAKLNLFRGAVESACGIQGSAVGPFYCPADQEAYIDLSFYKELRRRFKAPGDFAQAYVIAHEVGHHIQNLVGTSEKVHRAKRGKSKREQNEQSIRLELQADCLAGVWAHHSKNVELGDIDEAVRAAKAIGDDNIQRQATGQVNPGNWTHGSSEQRARWFKAGHRSGDVSACDTFSAARL